MNDLFVCDKCGCIESFQLVLERSAVIPGCQYLCSECAPVGVAQGGFKAGTGQWHGIFPKRQYDPVMDLVANRPTGLGLG